MKEIVLTQQKTADMDAYNLRMVLRSVEHLETASTNKQKITAWDTALFSGNGKPATRFSKLWAAYRLLKSFKGELKDATKKDLIDYKQSMVNDRLSPTTINGQLANLKQFFVFLEKPGVVDWIKIKRVKAGRLTAQEILSQNEILELVSAAYSLRDKAMILSLWESGCRAAEFLNLKIKDLHFEGNTVSFTVDGKTGQRQCFLVASVPSLIQWLEVHPQKNDSNAWLWAKQTHKTNTARLTNNGLRLQLILISKRTKITKPIFPHSFRHSRCTFTAKAGLNEMVMRQMFGWSRTSEMPSIYVSLAATDAKAAALELAGVRQPAEKEAPLKAKTCIRCGTIAPVDAIICQQCFFPLNAEAAQQQENELQGTIKAMILAALDEREKKAKT